MIKDLPININGHLTTDMRKRLTLIIEQEFDNKESLYHEIQKREKEKILEAYRKEVGYPKFKAEYEKAGRKVEEAKAYVTHCEETIKAIGLTTEGEPDTNCIYDNKEHVYITNYKGKALSKKLEAIEINAPSQNLKSKLITRLMLSTTVGEANEIMREVLGNGIIPPTDVKAITFQEK